MFTVHHGANLVPAFLEVYIDQILQYFPFILKKGSVFSLASGKLMKDLRPGLQPALNQEQKQF